MKTVSIITPSFNQGRFIERTIKSVLAQNIPNLEYLIVDGASNDETVKILKNYTNKLKWISEPDKGQTNAVNKGLQQTSGEIIGWLNSDDIHYPNTIQTVCDFFATHPEIDIIYGDAYHIDENDQIIEKYYTEPWNTERLKEVCYICQPTVFFRRTIIKKFGLLNEDLNYCMDYEYWLRLSLANVCFEYLPKALAGSRLYQDTKTLGSRVAVHKEINDMLKKHLGKVPDRWLSNYAHAKLAGTDLKRSTHHFKVLVAIMSIWASIRWNKYVSKNLLSNAIKWVIK